MNQDLIEIGYISKVHGVRGELVINLIDSNSKSIQRSSSIYVSDQNEAKEFKVETIRYGNKVLCRLESLNNCDDAKLLVGKKVCILRSVLKKTLNDDEYLLNDLINFEVLDSSNLYVGKIISFTSNNAQDLA